MSTRDLKGKNSKLIRGALSKTQFREQSESLFLTSGFVYESAEQAEAIFKGEETGFSIQGMPIQQSIHLKKEWR